MKLRNAFWGVTLKRDAKQIRFIVEWWPWKLMFFGYANERGLNVSCRNYTLPADSSALNALPLRTKVREFALVPIGNLKCNYPSF